LNLQTSNVRPCSVIQKEKEDLERENQELRNQVAKLTEEKKVLEDKNRNTMMAVTELYEMVEPLLPALAKGGTN